MNSEQMTNTPPPQGDDLVVFLAEARRAIDPHLRHRTVERARRRRRRTFLAGGVVALIVAGGGSAVVADNWFETTPDGRTYGGVPPSVDMGADTRGMPDLVAVLGDHGCEGYVPKDLLNAQYQADPPTSPEEALREQMARKRNPTVLPVYSADGATQIDTFTLGKSRKEFGQCRTSDGPVTP